MAEVKNAGREEELAGANAKPAGANNGDEENNGDGANNDWKGFADYDIRKSASVYAEIAGVMAGLGAAALFFKANLNAPASAALVVAIVAFGVGAIFYGIIHGATYQEGQAPLLADKIRGLLTHEIMYIGAGFLLTSIVFVLSGGAVVIVILASIFLTVTAFVYEGRSAVSIKPEVEAWTGKSRGFLVISVIVLLVIVGASWLVIGPAKDIIFVAAAVSIVDIGVVSYAFYLTGKSEPDDIFKKRHHRNEAILSWYTIIILLWLLLIMVLVPK